MGFITHVETALICDYCSVGFSDDGETHEVGGRARERRAAAKAVGWEHLEGLDVCPDCISSDEQELGGERHA